MAKRAEINVHIHVTEHAGTAVVRPAAERVDLLVAGEFRTLLLKLIAVGHRRLVVDLSDVHFVDSSGLGVLVSALKTLNGDGDIRLANVQPPVGAVLEVIRLHRVFNSYPSVETAVDSFV